MQKVAHVCFTLEGGLLTEVQLCLSLNYMETKLHLWTGYGLPQAQISQTMDL